MILHLARLLLRDCGAICRRICPRALVAAWIAFLLTCPAGAQAGLRAETKANGKKAGFGSVYCGPHCVRRVLQEYGIETELIDLIREMQWPAVEEGTSMQDLAAALTKRGLYAKAVDLDPQYDIEWDHPAIIHLEKDGVAHYVVWMPATKPMTSGRVYDNEGTEAVKPGRFDQLRTGPVLLTSDKPILDADAFGKRVRSKATSPWLWLAAALLMVGGFGCGWGLHRLYGGRRPSRRDTATL